MPEIRPGNGGTEERSGAFGQSIGRKVRRKIRARTQEQSIWSWLGAMGLVGWSVAVPTVIGVFLGRWMDSHWPGPASWTLTLLVVGVVVGCLTAWFWVKREGGNG